MKSVTFSADNSLFILAVRSACDTEQVMVQKLHQTIPYAKKSLSLRKFLLCGNTVHGHIAIPCFVNGYYKDPWSIITLKTWEVKAQPVESQWAQLREAQRKTLQVSNTGMAVTIDLGEWNDIHPLNKADVGKRLARIAQKTAYGDHKVIASGPAYQSMKIEGNKIVLRFANTGGGLTVKGGGALHHFAIAGADKKHIWATAMIQGNKVIVFNNQVPHPVAVRYAWADNPASANLYNKEGLPASPFKTDE